MDKDSELYNKAVKEAIEQMEENKPGLGDEVEDIRKVLQQERDEIEEVLEDNTLIEQGCVRFDSHIYITTSFFRRIICNHANMRSIINARIMKYQEKVDLDEDDPENKQTVDIYALMDSRSVPKRLLSRPCQIISDHEQV